MLEELAFLILSYLFVRGLPKVDDRLASQMLRFDFWIVQIQSLSRRYDNFHGNRMTTGNERHGHEAANLRGRTPSARQRSRGRSASRTAVARKRPAWCRGSTDAGPRVQARDAASLPRSECAVTAEGIGGDDEIKSARCVRRFDGGSRGDHPECPPSWVPSTCRLFGAAGCADRSARLDEIESPWPKAQKKIPRTISRTSAFGTPLRNSDTKFENMSPTAQNPPTL
jgi:hypothetical protein